MRFLSEAYVRWAAPAPDSRPKGFDPNLYEFIELRDLSARSGKRFAALSERASAEKKAFEAERETRSLRKFLRLGLAVVVCPLLLAAAWLLRRRKAAALAALVLLCAARPSRAAPGQEASDAALARHVAAAEGRLSAALDELESIASTLEGLAKTYPSVSDLGTAAEARLPLLQRAANATKTASQAREELDTLRKVTQQRRGIRLFSQAAMQRGKEARIRGLSAETLETGLKEGLEVSLFLGRARSRMRAVQERLLAENAAFERERETREGLLARKRYTAIGLGLVFLVTPAVVLWRRARG